jgi:hypothetical protein
MISFAGAMLATLLAQCEGIQSSGALSTPQEDGLCYFFFSPSPGSDFRGYSHVGRLQKPCITIHADLGSCALNFQAAAQLQATAYRSHQQCTEKKPP